MVLRVVLLRSSGRSVEHWRRLVLAARFARGGGQRAGSSDQEVADPPTRGRVALATPTTPRTRRPYGGGALYVRAGSAGRETWYATWYEHGRKVKRRIGRKDGEHGLSKR